MLEGSPSVGSASLEATKAPGDASALMPALSSNISGAMVTVLDIRGVKKRMGRIYRRFARQFALERAKSNQGCCYRLLCCCCCCCCRRKNPALSAAYVLVSSFRWRAV